MGCRDDLKVYEYFESRRVARSGGVESKGAIRDQGRNRSFRDRILTLSFSHVEAA